MKEYRNEIVEEIKNGLQTAYINSDYNSNLAYRPEIVFNDYKQGKKVLASIEEELSNCDEFAISVAFITMGGITPLLQIFKELERKNIYGRILTTDYLIFNNPEALKKLSELKNIELKMFMTNSEVGGFHTKGYIFRKEEVYRIIMGSSNMTGDAITKNREWNTKIISTQEGEIAKDILKEFENLWNDENTYDYEDVKEQYALRYKIEKEQKRIANSQKVASIEQYQLKPNKMQIAFIQNLKKMYEDGEKRMLLISATGTGKTYASAFALRELSPRRALFLVHREQIAKQALKSYQQVFGNTKTYGLLSGNSKSSQEMHADFVFSTMSMMAKPEIFHQFGKETFDICVLDEAHHSGNQSYLRIMNYFTPSLWLGMTASPDTNNYDIYSLFDHNIAYEIRLQQALEEDLLCPFHYFGITDIEIDGHVLDDDSKNVRNFSHMVCDARVDYVLKQAKYYGFSGNRVKGLIFCSRKDEAEELSHKFNERGLKTTFLSGEDSQEKRESEIDKLITDDVEDIRNGNYLDYIFSVDIFSEGTDIVQINQVIMLRPTKSPVVFIQQLGRGLRKAEGKEYVVILDFIGNYMNNFMIPIALSGDKSYNKDTIRRYVREGSRVIPGTSTIHFDEISKKRIFASIDKMTTKKKMLTEKYQVLKYRLGKIPTILDFYEYGEIDPMIFIEYAGSYDQFVRMADEEYTVSFSKDEETALEFVSAFLINGKRLHELLMLKQLMEQGVFSEQSIRSEMETYGEKLKSEDYISACAILHKDFLNSPSDKKNFSNIEFMNPEVQQLRQVKRAFSFAQRLQKLPFEREMSNLIAYGIRRYEDSYQNHDEDNLVLYQKYSRKDVCRLLNWEHDDSSTMYGYRIKYNTCPIFVTYEKEENITNSTKYEDRFMNDRVFSWMTRSKVSIESQESQQLIHHKETGLKIYLFIKKNDGEGTDFYYMGKATPMAWEQTTIENDDGRQLPIMNFQLYLQHAVRSDIYEYFTK